MRTRALVCVAAAAAAVVPLALHAARTPRPQLPPAKRAELAARPVRSGPSKPKTRLFPRPGRREPLWRSGVIASGLAPFPEAAFVATNQWQGLLAGSHVNVYAGALGSDRSRGAVAIVRGGAARFVVAPQPRGPLTITRAREGELSLRSVSGRAYCFDVRSDRLSTARR